jgi:hypothetical protein
MNSTVPESYVDAHLAEDPEAGDQAYRNQLAQRIFALSGGMCWPR